MIDNQTRAVASMIEVADFVGSGRDLLVVVEDITGQAPTIGGDRLSPREVEDLNRGRAFVRTITDEGGCSVETTVQKAVTALVDVSYLWWVWVCVGVCVYACAHVYVCRPLLLLSLHLPIYQPVNVRQCLNLSLVLSLCVPDISMGTVFSRRRQIWSDI